MTILTIFYTVFFSISLIYFLIITLINIGIFRIKRFRRKSEPLLTKITIIIPARNEEKTIGNCLANISNQDYPGHLMEIIIINDNSVDQTEKIILEFAQLHPSMNIKLISTPAIGIDQAFKKHSIKLGADNSTGELLITTDADTYLKPGWISSMVGFFSQHHPQMIIGPVTFCKESSLFSRLQSMEFSGLMAATAGSCEMEFPLMCNGANLAFTRKAYNATISLDEDLRYPSGDDLFLMMKIKKKYGSGSVKYLFSEDAVVSVKAKKTLNEFFSQRIRWVSKSRGYSDPIILIISIITWLFNCLLLSALLAGIFSFHLFTFSLIILVIKMIIEFPAVWRIMALSENKTWFLYPLTQVLNLVYVTLIGILGNVLSYEWKGRNITHLKRNSQG